MDREGLLGFALTCLVIELTPGPNMAYLAVLSATSGRRSGFAATAGIALGLMLVGIGAALGLTAVIGSSRWLYESWRWAGVLYLFWLAWEGWQGTNETSPGDARVLQNDATYFSRGLITNLLNPKAGIFYVAILPTFLDPSRAFASQAVLLSVIYVLIATTIHSTIVLSANAAEPWLRDPERSITVRRYLSGALVIIALWLAYATRYATTQ
ncbi:MAG: LysE family translocator [Hyphomicrobiaceae bacterium]|nr:LysE family translocator [Hyphomicrobiaceae bacterium]